MTLEDFIVIYWPVIAGIVFVIVWAVRIEGALRSLSQEVKALKATRNEDQVLASDSRREVHDTLKIIQKDIKDILRAMSK